MKLSEKGTRVTRIEYRNAYFVIAACADGEEYILQNCGYYYSNDARLKAIDVEQAGEIALGSVWMPYVRGGIN